MFWVMRGAVTGDGEKYKMKNFPNSIKVIKREGSGYRSIVDYMGQT
jgi:hypothetical protein